MYVMMVNFTCMGFLALSVYANGKVDSDMRLNAMLVDIWEANANRDIEILIRLDGIVFFLFISVFEIRATYVIRGCRSTLSVLRYQFFSESYFHDCGSDVIVVGRKPIFVLVPVPVAVSPLIYHNVISSWMNGRFYWSYYVDFECKIQENWCTVTVAPTIEHHGGHSRTPINQRWDQVPGRSICRVLSKVNWFYVPNPKSRSEDTLDISVSDKNVTSLLDRCFHTAAQIRMLYFTPCTSSKL